MACRAGTLDEAGLTRARFTQGLIVFVGIGVVAAALGVVAVLLPHDRSHAPGAAKVVALLAFLLAMPPALWLVLAAVLGSVTVRLDDGELAQVLWRRIVLRRQPVARLTKVTGGGFAAMVLHFRGGPKIALPGIHAEDAHAFLAALDALRPDLGLLDRE